MNTTSSHWVASIKDHNGARVVHRFRARGEGVMPGDHFRSRVGLVGHSSRVSKKPQTPINSKRPRRNPATSHLQIRASLDEISEAIAMLAFALD